MNKKQVLILWIIAAVLGLAVAVAKVNQNRGAKSVTKLERGDLLFESIPVGTLTSVTIEDHEHTVTLARTDGGWVVREREDYPASLQMLAGFFDKLNEVRVGQGLEAGPSYNPRFGMDAGADEAEERGVTVTLVAPGRDPWVVSLGKTTSSGASMMNPMAPPGGGGRYVRTSEDPESVYVVEETFSRTSANPKDWLSDDFLQVTRLKNVTLRAPNDEGFEPWILRRKTDDGDFSMDGLGDNEELIPTAVNPLKNLFSFARFEDVLTEEEAKDLRDTALARQATIGTFDGFTYTVDVAPRKAGDGSEAAANPNYLMSLTVTATLPEARTPAEGETEKQKEEKDAAFAKKQEQLRTRLAREQEFQGRVFEVSKWTVDAILKSRADLAQPKPEPAPVPEPVPAPGLEDAFGFPEGR